MMSTTRSLLRGLTVYIKKYQKNCPYCHGNSAHDGNGKALVFDDADNGIAYINKNILWVGSEWGECDGCYIRFCPKCGRRLTKN